MNENLDEEDKPHPEQYDAPQGSKRDAQLDRITKMAKSDSAKQRKAAYAARERMEKAEREKPGWKNRPRSDSKKEGHEVEEMTEGLDLLREMIEEVLAEALSKKTKATLRKKAEDRGLTPGSVEAEYKKGLAAWATSGSRKGMSQHQWAMARVNSANPSKDWAVVKKSKRKKKS